MPTDQPPPECYSCTECGFVSTDPTTLVKSNITYLSQCVVCDQSSDKFVQFDPILLTLNVLLTRSSAFIHIAHNRLKNANVFKLLAFILFWLSITTFAFSAGLAGLDLNDLITSTPSTISTTTKSIIPHSRPHFASTNPMLTHFLQNLPQSFTVPPHFATLMLVDLIGLTFFVITFPAFLILRFSGQSRSGSHQQRNSSNQKVQPLTYLQSMTLLIKFFTPSLLSRSFTLLALLYRLEPVYYAFLLIFVYTGLFISNSLYYHTIRGYYGISPNLHKIDIISVFPHIVPILFTLLSDFAISFFLLQYLSPELYSTLPSVTEAVAHILQ